MKTPNIICNSTGLTLVELMVVLALSLLLMATVYLTFQVQKTTSDTQHQVAMVQQDLRAVLDVMAKDIRQAGCDPTLQTTAGIIASLSGPHRLSVTMDLNEDGDTSDTSPEEQVSYFFSGTVLTRNGEELASGVTSMGFTYYDEDNAVITPAESGGTALTTNQAASVRDMEVFLRIESDKVDPDTGNPVARSMVKRVRMRNQEY